MQSTWNMKSQALHTWILAVNALTAARFRRAREMQLRTLLVAEQAAWESYTSLPSDLDAHEVRS